MKKNPTLTLVPVKEDLKTCLFTLQAGNPPIGLLKYMHQTASSFPVPVKRSQQNKEDFGKNNNIYYRTNI